MIEKNIPNDLLIFSTWVLTTSIGSALGDVGQFITGPIVVGTFQAIVLAPWWGKVAVKWAILSAICGALGCFTGLFIGISMMLALFLWVIFERFDPSGMLIFQKLSQLGWSNIMAARRVGAVQGAIIGLVASSCTGWWLLRLECKLKRATTLG